MSRIVNETTGAIVRFFAGTVGTLDCVSFARMCSPRKLNPTIPHGAFPRPKVEALNIAEL